MIGGLKPYPEYRESGVPWLGRIPAHWEIRKLRSLVKPRKERNRTDLPLLSVVREKGVIRRSMTGDDDNHNFIPDNLSNHKVCRAGDLVINKMKAWQGSLGIAPCDGIVSPAYFVFDFGLTNRTFGQTLLRSKPYVGAFARASDGVRIGQWDLAIPRMREIEVLLPSPDEQSAIVRFLVSANQRFEAAARAKKELIALLNEQKQFIIHRAVTRGLDPNVRLKPSGIAWLVNLPQHWEVRRLKWVVRLQRGYDLPAEKRTHGCIPVVSSGGIIDTHSVSRATGPGVVMGRYGSTDSVFYIESDFWPHNTALYVTDFQGNDRRWCYYLLRTISKGDYAGKSAVPGVDRKDLYEIVVPRPPRVEQREIAGSLDAHLADLERATERTEREIDLIREYRTRIIADVVTGQLDVREVSRTLPAEVDAPELSVEACTEDESEELLEAVADHE